MSLIERMNLAVDYLEAHITEPINWSAVAKIAGCSAYNFQRMFSFAADISVTEYVRRRRLTLAALELKDPDAKVMDVALKYGYESPISFARAFKAMHGINPGEAKKSGSALVAFPKIAFQITVKGVSEVNYRIVTAGPFTVFGIEGLISTAGEPGYYGSVGEMWAQNHQNGSYEQLAADAGKQKPFQHDELFVCPMCGIHGMMNYKKLNDTTYGYMQCCLPGPDSKIEGYTVFEVPKATWAVFPADLPDWGKIGDVIGELNRRFYTEWLPASDYEKADAPEFEMYGGTPEHGYFELWLPIVKK